jgi:2-polyprenyl-3-methyl-5-hydroxy-6-metoxy-1,4-benzoquinol methylase
MELKEHRMNAAIASKGISGGPVRKMALKQLSQLDLSGSLLDYGAGVGDLLMDISARFGIKDLTGVDILPRPENLDENINWHQQDLNDEFDLNQKYHIIISTEVIEHLENPRATFRNIFRLLAPGGHAIVTTPNQNSIRAISALALGGHFAAFLGSSYPAHITALTKLDLERIAKETGFEVEHFFYTNAGGIPKMPRVKWQQISFGLLKGPRFSDNIGVLLKKPL